MKSFAENATNEEHAMMMQQIKSLKAKNYDLKLQLERSESHENDAIALKMNEIRKLCCDNAKLNGDLSKWKKKANDRVINLRVVKRRIKSYQKKMKDCFPSVKMEEEMIKFVANRAEISRCNLTNKL